MSAGVLYVHSCPPALCPHVEWAVAAELGTRARMEWSDQPAAPGQLRAEINWRGRSGTAGRLAAALRGWTMLRYEVTEDPSPGADDPLLFRSGLLEQYAAVRDQQGLPDGALAGLAGDAVRGSAAPDGLKTELLDGIDAWLGAP